MDLDFMKFNPQSVNMHGLWLACGLPLYPTAELRRLHLILDKTERTHIRFEIL